jgi:hypothetical protein
MNEDIKIKKYTLWIAIIGLLTVIVTQWGDLFPKKENPQQPPTQPTINIKNEINNNNDNQNQVKTSPNEQPTTRAKKPERPTNPEPTILNEPEKVEKEIPRQFISKIVNEAGIGVANAEVYCPNCLTKKVKTDLDGNFTLNGFFDNNAAFWQSALTISKDKKSITTTIDWREKSPQPINF